MGPALPAGAGALVLLLGLGCALPAAAQSRGELLYNTHCLACHNDQLHWRNKRQAVDWASLTAQVRLWQATAALGWDEDDITQVALYLNDTYYRFAPPVQPRGRAAAQPPWAPRP